MPSYRLAAALAPLAALALLAAPAHAEAVKAGEWTPIFDGRTLDGWTPKIAGYPAGENYAQTFVVQDGAIAVSYAG
ncbi:MAG: 3-keto-disaccharide hydrolase, partial [Phenylobacterium sp.]